MHRRFKSGATRIDNNLVTPLKVTGISTAPMTSKCWPPAVESLILVSCRRLRLTWRFDNPRGCSGTANRTDVFRPTEWKDYGRSAPCPGSSLGISPWLPVDGYKPAVRKRSPYRQVDAQQPLALVSRHARIERDFPDIKLMLGFVDG
ncbi:uncharacterized protein LOC129756064 [Uranotaenia lowii]|uniref:uncharacterized protein LOC129756064 n=1 Tax=Uranotaenia lowii TaxID=190385 RepID=UPI00247AB8D3|nr:uncharacterized protein LOC129756064 [Uranotaenia lowii]XP_055608793.1 uncharacterized protein LOC129756064 [Uranotaenia lowii]